MFRVTALYPNNQGSHFDGDYYQRKHTPFATALLAPHGLESIRTTMGVATLEGAPPPFWSISEMLFSSRRAFDDAMTACGGELFADIANYTNASPILQISELSDD